MRLNRPTRPGVESEHHRRRLGTENTGSAPYVGGYVSCRGYGGVNGSGMTVGLWLGISMMSRRDLRRLIGGPLQPAPGTRGLCRLSFLVRHEVGGDEALVDDAVRRSRGDRRLLADRAGLRQGAYPHARRRPLTLAVELDEAGTGRVGRADGFGNECEGHCGYGCFRNG